MDANALNQGFKDIEDLITKFKPEVIIFTAAMPSFSDDCQVAKIAKRIDKKIRTILLESHVIPVMTEKIKQKFPEIDDLVGVEPLVVIPRLLGFEEVADLENHPLPAYDLLPIKKYFSVSFTRRKPFVSLVTSVGCSNRCNFCIVGGATVERGYGQKWRFKSAKKILEEITFVMGLGVKNVNFFDETFTVSKPRVQELCQLMIERGVKIDWSCNGRVDSLDEKTIKMMKRAGCWNIMFGIECGSQGLLEEANKGTTLSRALEIVQLCKNNGIQVSASFVVGLPHETMKTINKTLEIAKKIKIYRIQFDVLTPLPGTKYYDEAKRSGLLETDYSFSGYDAYCIDDVPVVRTEKMTSRELADAHKYIYRKFYLRPAYIFHMLVSTRSWGQFISLFKSLAYLK